MNRRINPSNVAGPFGAYTHAIAVDPGARLLVLSGQVGTDADESTPESVEEQSFLVYDNIRKILETEGMGFGDIVKVTMFVVAGTDIAAVRAGRERAMGSIEPPTSTLVYISALAQPHWKVEVEAIAAKAG